MKDMALSDKKNSLAKTPVHADETVVLVDLSGSMEEKDGGSGRTRLDILKEALAQLAESPVRIIGFHTKAFTVGNPKELPEVGGGTALHLGIVEACKYNPVRTVIISDGEPDSQGQAHVALEQLSGIVDVVYCGPERNQSAKQFLESLAKHGMGTFYETGDKIDGPKQLHGVIKGLLGK